MTFVTKKVVIFFEGFPNRGLVMSSSVICCPVVLQVTVCYHALDTIDVRFSSLNIRGEYKPEHFGKEQNE